MNCPSCQQPVCRCHPVVQRLRSWIEAPRGDGQKTIEARNVIIEESAQTIDDLTARVKILEDENDEFRTHPECDECENKKEVIELLCQKLATAQERIHVLEAQVNKQIEELDLQWLGMHQVELDRLNKESTTAQERIKELETELSNWKRGLILGEMTRTKIEALEDRFTRMYEAGKIGDSAYEQTLSPTYREAHNRHLDEIKGEKAEQEVRDHMKYEMEDLYPKIKSLEALADRLVEAGKIPRHESVQDLKFSDWIVQHNRRLDEIRRGEGK